MSRWWDRLRPRRRKIVLRLDERDYVALRTALKMAMDELWYSGTGMPTRERMIVIERDLARQWWKDER